MKKRRRRKRLKKNAGLRQTKRAEFKNMYTSILCNFRTTVIKRRLFKKLPDTGGWGEGGRVTSAEGQSQTGISTRITCTNAETRVVLSKSRACRWL